ncbi:MAG: acyltransferase [Lachnospiraceae bacterium]|nr:acyltransferase [Lachnospiraceae bacterium]
MNEKKIENRFLYFLEGIACISVIFIHCMFPSWLGVLVCGLARFAVPMFFMVSGYYLNQSEMEKNQVRKKAKKKFFRIGRVLVVAVIFYTFWTSFRMYLSEGSIFDFIDKLVRPRQLFATLVLNDFTILGGHLWFLAALLYCYLIYYAMGSKIQNHVVYLSIPLLLGVHVLARFLCSLFGIERILGIPIYIWFRNWLFMALPFFVMGDWIRCYKKRILRWFQKKQLMILFLTGVLLSIIETLLIYRLTGDDRELYLGTFLMVFSMFCYAIQMPNQCGVLWIENIGRRYLLFIYIIHLAVAEGMDILFFKAGFDGMEWMNDIKPFFVLGLSVTGAIFWDKLVYNKKERKYYG